MRLLSSPSDHDTTGRNGTAWVRWSRKEQTDPQRIATRRAALSRRHGRRGLSLLAPADLLYIDAAQFGARGLIVEGMERSLGVSVFTLLLMALVAALDASGVLGRILGWVEARTATPRGAELWTFATVSAAVLLTTHSVVAILAVGPFTRRVGERFGLDPYRRSNLLDVTVCTYPFLLPYCIPTILVASLIAGSGPVRISPLAAGLHNFHSWALLIVIVIAVLTGYGRGAPAHRVPSNEDAANNLRTDHVM